MVSQWFNTEADIDLIRLRGTVVVIEAFQMLCPGCVSHGLPQAQAIHDMFPRDQVSVIGLHSVFEHHAAMTPTSLEAFLHEYRIAFPVGVDREGEGASPQTMAAYEMRGTPTLVLIDCKGNRRAQYFGQVQDLRIGYDIATLLNETNVVPVQDVPANTDEVTGDDSGCRAPLR